MVKKLFALASVTALTGLMVTIGVAGCSSTTEVTEPTADSGTTPDAAVKPKADAGDPDEETEAGPAVCPPPASPQITAAEIEAQLKWMPPTVEKTACAQGDLDAITDLFKKNPTGVQYTDLEKALSATCAPCVFTNAAASPKWQMFIKGSGGYIDNSAGACFAAVKDEACGKARFQWELCVDGACNETDCATDDQNKIRTCIGKAANGVCKDITTAYTTACPDEQTYIDACGSILSAIAGVCGGGPDGGLDASIQP